MIPCILAGIGLLLLLLLVYDLAQKRLPILRNFPIIGHLRYLLVRIGPELRQYIIAHNREEAPFNRSERDWIERTADGKNNYFGFGTDDQIYGIGYPIIKNAAVGYGQSYFTASLKDKDVSLPCAKVFGEHHKRKKPYRAPSLINISAMSFGSLSGRAVEAMNKGAKEADCYHNTGEGGFASYHNFGADIMLQIGTGKFGIRDLDGNFSMEKLVRLCQQHPAIKTIEIKLSQGAKPGKGGVLPAKKVTEEIAAIRGVEPWQDCISPNRHKEFETPKQLIDFVEAIAEATGLPVGIKAAIGKTDFYEELAREMKRTGKGIDFFSVDGGEGGTGAAPLTFADHISLPFKLGFTRVYQIFLQAGLADKILWIGSGKLGFPDRAIVAMAMGCDIIHIAREAMIAVGCIQAQKCHTDACPTGVATHNKWLTRGLDPDLQSKRLARFLKTFRNEIAAAANAAGYPHPAHFTMEDIELSAGPGIFKTLKELYGYEKAPAA
jgi:glutamate synthase (ferredoxin)